MKVRKGSVYVYRPVLLDQFDARTTLKPGDQVRVCHPMGCPPPNSMGHAHVETLDGEFVGLVCTNSLHKE
jgi:hypothetical protein